VATELGKNLAKRGHEVHFITYAPPQRMDAFQERVFYHEVEIPDYPLFEYAPYSLALAGVMAEVAKNHNLDLIHSHYAIPHAASAYLAQQISGGRLKTVTTLHGTDIFLVGNQPSFLPIVKFSIERSDGITAVSQYLAEITKSEFHIQKPIEVIPNFVDSEYFKKRYELNARRRLAQDEQSILVHISNFRPVKRPEDLIYVLELVVKEFDAILVLIGDGPLRSKVEALCREKWLSNRVLFLGKQLCLAELLSVADIYLCTSEMESFGLSSLEAMACSLPVVSTNVGGVPEVVVEGETGYLTSVGDIEAMAEKVKILLSDKILRMKMGESGRKRVEKHFNANIVVNKYEELYQRVI
jgi:N-acetyl-alpha-D-glucosaminyl L-malate synthase BshA